MKDGIHRFWVGPYTKYGCSECRMAGWSPDEIDHAEGCSVSTDS